MSSAREFWSTVRDAVRGVTADYTDAPLGRSILLLSVPMILEMSMESVFAVVDVYFVMRLGSAAAATVGVTEAMLTLIYAVAIGLSMGVTAMVARRVGEGRRGEAAAVAVQAIVLAVGLSAALGLAGGTFAPELLRLMGATPEMVATGAGYTAIIFSSNIVIFLLFLINAVFRGAGDASMAMRSLWLANLINIALDPCLIFGLGPFPELGLTGAAVATTIGRGSGVLYQLTALARGRGRVVITRKHLRVRVAIMLRLMRVSIFGILQFLVATASWVGLVRIIAVFGGTVLAGYTLAVRILIFALLPAWGMSHAVATLVGQNLGAGRPERAERAVWLASRYNMAFLGAVGIVFVLFAEPIVGLFTADAGVVRSGSDCLRIVSLGYVFYALGMVVIQAFNGAGDTLTPTLINLGCFWLFQIPLAWTLARETALGPRGVYVAIAVAESLVAVVAVILFRRGGWKATRV